MHRLHRNAAGAEESQALIDRVDCGVNGSQAARVSSYALEVERNV